MNHWQFGIGEHASELRRILGSVVLTAKSKSGRLGRIRHLVVEGYSQQLIGRNVTFKANSTLSGKNAIEISNDGENDYISMVVRDRSSFIPMSSFNVMNDEHVSVMWCLNGNTVENKQRDHFKTIVVMVHKQVCGTATFTNIKILLRRIDMWNESVKKYVSHLVDRCVSCRAMSPPQPSGKVPITLLSQDLNEIVFFDHFFLDSGRIFQTTYLTIRCSAACIVLDTSMDSALKTCWIRQFWIPKFNCSGQAYVTGSFRMFCEVQDIKLSPDSPSQHTKSTIKSKHGKTH